MPPLDSRTQFFFVAALWLGVLMLAWVVIGRWRLREQARARAWAEDVAMEATHVEIEELERQGFLKRWLYLAGFRSKSAPATFVVATASCALIGIAIVVFARQTGLTDGAVQAAGSVPGGVGELAAPMIASSPWIVLGMLVLMPLAVVSSTRTKRVREVEQDLPVTLELLATMSESGLAFDSALDRVIDSSPLERPLFAELRTFQVESLGGVGRVECFRRFARRLEIPSIAIFSSALVQAEQIGSGYTRVLRVQADDLRNRRREQANMLAQSLTVKLVFPLVLCFLPGIFVATLGPAVLEFLKLIEGVAPGR